MQHLRTAVNLVHPITLESHIVKICATHGEALDLAIFRMREEIKYSPLSGKIKLVHYTNKSSPWHETEAHRLREAIGTESRKYFMQGKAFEDMPRVYAVSWTGCEDNRLI